MTQDLAVLVLFAFHEQCPIALRRAYEPYMDSKESVRQILQGVFFTFHTLLTSKLHHFHPINLPITVHTLTIHRVLTRIS